MPVRQRITIIGVGLLGGSLALALKKKNIQLVGWNPKDSSRQKASRILKMASTLDKAVRDADIVLLCSHSSSIPFLLRKLKPLVQHHTLLMDVSSVKEPIVKWAQKIENIENHFVPCHPMAGKEKSGVEFADAQLYAGRYVYITPLPKNPKILIERAVTFWKNLGAMPIIMDAKVHDQYVALTSHLPHLLASAFVQLYGAHEKRSKQIQLAVGPGFRDFTRIAASNPSMWSDILEMNSDEILFFLSQYRRQLVQLEKKLEKSRKSFWLSFFEKSRAIRIKLP